MDGLVISGSSTPVSSNILIASFNATVLADYLREVFSVTLGGTKSDLEGPGSVFHQDCHAETLHRLSRFATEPLVALYASKDAFENDQPLSDPTSKCESVRLLAVPDTFSIPLKHYYQFLCVLHIFRIIFITVDCFFGGYHQTPTAT